MTRETTGGVTMQHSCSSSFLRTTFVVVALFSVVLTMCVFSFIEVSIKLPIGTVNLPRKSKSSVRNLTDLPNVRMNVRNVFNSTKQADLHEKFHSILWYKKPSWVSLTDAVYRLNKCPYKNCKMTNNATDLYSHSAIVFTLTEGLDKCPPLPLQVRPADQVWVLFYLEPPVNVRGYTDVVIDAWKYTINWTMTYRLDSDVLRPYGALQTRKPRLSRDYRNIYDRKSKFAAWFVSCCGTESGRDEYVYELRKYGVSVDVYGNCGNMGFQERQTLSHLLNQDYKFYFSFENNLCPDYISEKLFMNYNLDIVLVVRGGASYKQLLPSGVVIDTADFNSPKELADYLSMVNSSKQLYADFLQRKDTYIAYDIDSVTDYSYCKLCEKLNNKQDNINVYENLVDFVHLPEYSCVAPTDVRYVPRRRLVIIAVFSATCFLYTLFMSLPSISKRR